MSDKSTIHTPEESAETLSKLWETLTEGMSPTEIKIAQTLTAASAMFFTRLLNAAEKRDE